MTLNPRTLELARRVAQRCPIAMLTNNGWLLKESLPHLVPEILAVFGSNAHASCEFGACKPQLAVFERILARYRADRHVVSSSMTIQTMSRPRAASA